MLGNQPHLSDAAVLPLLAVEDLGLPHHAGAVFKLRFKLHVRRGHRQDPARDGQDLAHAAHRRVKGGGDAVQRRQEEVAEALPCQGPLGKPVAHQLAHQRLRVG